jgi:hypothetical protein
VFTISKPLSCAACHIMKAQGHCLLTLSRSSMFPREHWLPNVCRSCLLVPSLCNVVLNCPPLFPLFFQKIALLLILDFIEFYEYEFPENCIRLDMGSGFQCRKGLWSLAFSHLLSNVPLEIQEEMCPENWGFFFFFSPHAYHVNLEFSPPQADRTGRKVSPVPSFALSV